MPSWGQRGSEATESAGTATKTLHRLRPERQCAAGRSLERISAGGRAAAVPGGKHGAEPGGRQQSRLAGTQSQSFTATPLHCGSRRTGFRRTADYGGMRDRLSLGTAMAISGAAISPNMGYNSSPLVGFIMTLFNVRLGWWSGNPCAGDRTVQSDGPYFGAGAVVRELFG